MLTSLQVLLGLALFASACDTVTDVPLLNTHGYREIHENMHPVSAGKGCDSAQSYREFFALNEHGDLVRIGTCCQGGVYDDRIMRHWEFHDGGSDE